MQLVQQLLRLLEQNQGPVAIQAGHFQVEVDPRTNLVYSAVSEELVYKQAPKAIIESVRERIGIFPMATFGLAIELTQQLKRAGREVKILTLVDDLTASMRRSAQGADQARKRFYQGYPGTLHVYERLLREQGLDPQEILIGINPKQTLVSETWLRRKRFKARLERGTKLEQNELIKSEDGTFTLEGLSCPIMTQGQATCAGEVCELHMQLHEKGFRTLVNFYPQVCRGFVEASFEVADRLWGLDGYRSFEIGLLGSGAQTFDELTQNMRFRVTP
jgi:hypothetical protein